LNFEHARQQPACTALGVPPREGATSRLSGFVADVAPPKKAPPGSSQGSARMDKGLELGTSAAAVAQVLPTDSAAKLLRVFCFLRQHDRKARIARKTAELSAWRPLPQQQRQKPEESDLGEQSSPTEALDETELVAELNLLAAGRGKSGDPAGNGSRNATAVAAKATPPPPTAHEMRNEIKGLQKGLITSSSDTSGVITAADLSSCMRSLNRIPAKVCFADAYR
jgi:hypothetical protein